jgi:hypothetical protein
MKNTTNGIFVFLGVLLLLPDILQPTPLTLQQVAVGILVGFLFAWGRAVMRSFWCCAELDFVAAVICSITWLVIGFFNVERFNLPIAWSALGCIGCFEQMSRRQAHIEEVPTSSETSQIQESGLFRKFFAKKL